MNTYTAKQLTDLLHEEEPSLPLRTVRYYTQIGLVPPLETVGNKRVYTDTHVHYFRAVLTLSKRGESLASIQSRLEGLSLEEVAKIGESLRLFRSEQLLDNETIAIGEDVLLSVSPRVSAELREQMIETVSRLLKGEDIR